MTRYFDPKDNNTILSFSSAASANDPRSLEGQFRKEQYFVLFEKQKGRCAICDKHQANSKTTFHVDHDHETGKVRGLLCGVCNSQLSRTRKDPELNQKAQDYLNQYKEPA